MRCRMVYKKVFIGACLWLLAIPGLSSAQKIKLGSSLSPPSLDSITPYVAIEKGFFKKNGVDAEVVEFRGDATHVKALLSGEIDLSINAGATEGIVSASKKAPVKLWVVVNPITPYHFVARKEAGTTLQALIGKNIAVSGIGAKRDDLQLLDPIEVRFNGWRAMTRLVAVRSIEEKRIRIQRSAKGHVADDAWSEVHPIGRRARQWQVLNQRAIDEHR